MYVCDCAGGRENDVTVSWGMKEFIWLTHGNHGGWRDILNLVSICPFLH